MTEKIHWRKNKDPKFLSGEDLKFNLIEGMPDGVVAVISHVVMDEAYDRGASKKTQVGVLMFKNLDGKPLAKGVIPAGWTSDFMKRNGVASPFINDWVGQKVVIYAKSDKAHGYVVRFKKYNDPNVKVKLKPDTVSWDKAIKWLNESPDNKLKDVLAKYDISKADQKKMEAACKKA